MPELYDLLVVIFLYGTPRTFHILVFCAICSNLYVLRIIPISGDDKRGV